MANERTEPTLPQEQHVEKPIEQHVEKPMTAADRKLEAEAKKIEAEAREIDHKTSSAARAEQRAEKTAKWKRGTAVGLLAMSILPAVIGGGKMLFGDKSEERASAQFNEVSRLVGIDPKTSFSMKGLTGEEKIATGFARCYYEGMRTSFVGLNEKGLKGDDLTTAFKMSTQTIAQKCAAIVGAPVDANGKMEIPQLPVVEDVLRVKKSIARLTADVN